MIVKELVPTNKKSLLSAPLLSFSNIDNKKPYLDRSKKAQLRRLKVNEHWDQYIQHTADYISNYTVQDFKNPETLNLLWSLAKKCQEHDENELAKDLYRLILKHDRRFLRVALEKYDSLNYNDQIIYADTSHYYRLVEQRKLIDTLAVPKDVLVEMSDNINSIFDDYGMTYSVFDQALLFTSNRTDRDTSDLAIIKEDLYGAKINEDIFIAYKEKYDWTEAVPFDAINSEYKEGSPCMSQDGQELYFVRCNSSLGLGDCDLYVSKKDAEGNWGVPENLGPNVNSVNWDSHPTLSPKADTLYFSSNRGGGFGGSDLYYSTKNHDGEWNKARNMGPVINTKNDEVSPFFHPKYSVLYFSSNGQLLNFGNFDIYKSYLLPDGKHTEPLNVGPLVNGIGNEFYFSIDTDSKWLFYSKSSKGKAGDVLNIHSFGLPMGAKPNNTIRFSGIVKEPTTGETFEGVVTIIDVSEATEVAPRHIRPDGSFDFELIDNRDYLLIVEGDNFFKFEELFHLNGETHVEIPVVRNNTSITFESIDFESGSYRLLPEMENNLHLIIQFLEQYPDFHIMVIGHTDEDGNHQLNIDLSQKRADAIRDYILSYGGFENDRVYAFGLGSTAPIHTVADTEEEKRMNRRVEFKIFRSTNELQEKYKELLN
ncbi:WD40 repeat protein [Sediminitomix flava]|uniref:WD40 repeat protein n=2 Tax=Sediminitomix flava TaxID=379075 RepID=A0A315Z5N9_SEDFL|nr:WD40 repeat protein [Sediminitomix flava]